MCSTWGFSDVHFCDLWLLEGANWGNQKTLLTLYLSYIILHLECSTWVCEGQRQVRLFLILLIFHMDVDVILSVLCFIDW